MDTDDKDIVLALLHLIRKDECQSALNAWFDRCQSKPEVYQNCLYAQKLQKPDACCPCLESKLRTLSLYQHDGDEFEALLVDGARKLSLYHSQRHT